MFPNLFPNLFPRKEMTAMGDHAEVYTRSGVELKTSTGKDGKPRMAWREWLRYSTAAIVDGAERNKWHKKSRMSPVAVVVDRNGEPTRKNRKDAERSAERWRKEMNAAERESERRGPAAMAARADTVAAYVDCYIDAEELGGRIEPSTVRGYRTTAKHITRAFSETPLKELRPDGVKRWLTSLTAAGLSASTVTKALKLLRMVMEDAVNMGALDANPTRGVKPPKLTKKNPGINALDAAGASSLSAVLENLTPTPTTVAAMIALNTGLRQGEVCGLQWRDYDEGAGVLWVRRALGNGKGGEYVKEPKTGKARDVAVNDRLAAFLAKWRLHLATQGFAADGPEFVIPNADGGFTQAEYVSKEWRTLSRALGLVGTEGRPVTFHDLRHTWATLAISNGVDVKTVSGNLGHANAAMTLNVYASADADAKRRAAETMGRVLAPKEGVVLPFRTGTEG